jgi:hypothetical protein
VGSFKARDHERSTDYVSGRIFMSYRREETSYAAGWLFDRLSGHFGR